MLIRCRSGLLSCGRLKIVYSQLVFTEDPAETDCGASAEEVDAVEEEICERGLERKKRQNIRVEGANGSERKSSKEKEWKWNEEESGREGIITEEGKKRERSNKAECRREKKTVENYFRNEWLSH